MRSLKILLASFALAALASSAQASAASTCAEACGRSFSQCTSGGGEQTACMKTWNQCRNMCAGVKPTAQSKPAATIAAPVKKVAAR